MARPTLEWRSAIEVLTVDTPDSSEFLEFDFYGWVKYKDLKTILADDIALGRWLGVAHTFGQAMTYWILNDTGYIFRGHQFDHREKMKFIQRQRSKLV
jgi:hypothetical protein